jgi:uncharacterized LabA/DUF88 family protein
MNVFALQNAMHRRSIVFIDASNLLASWRAFAVSNRANRRIDYRKLLETLTKDTEFIRGYYYDAAPLIIDSKRQGFFDKLRSLEITIVTKPLRYKYVTCRHCSATDRDVPYQKGVDVALVTDLMGLAFEKAYDIAIVISGDNDLVDAVNYVKNKGIKVWVASFGNALGQDIMRTADRVIQLDKVAQDIILERKI